MERFGDTNHRTRRNSGLRESEHEPLTVFEVDRHVRRRRNSAVTVTGGWENGTCRRTCRLSTGLSQPRSAAEVRQHGSPAGHRCRRFDMLRLTWMSMGRRGGAGAGRRQVPSLRTSSLEVLDGSQLIPLGAILRCSARPTRTRRGERSGTGVACWNCTEAPPRLVLGDLPDVVEWIRDDGPSSLAEADFAPDRLLSLRTRDSAAYNTLQASMTSSRRGPPTISTRADIHHIFPQKRRPSDRRASWNPS